MNWRYAVCMPLLYMQLGFKGCKIPLGLQRMYLDVVCPIDRRGNTVTLDLFIYPSVKGKRKSSKHRVYCACPKCGKEVPLGRLHQHIGAKTCASKLASI